MRFKFLLPALILLASVAAMAQSTAGTLSKFLPNPLQSPDVVTYQMQQFLMKRVPKLPAPTSGAEWTREAQQIRERVLNDVIYHGGPKD